MKFICNRENISADIAEIIRAFDPRALETDGGGEVRLTFTRAENSAEILLEYYELENTPKYTFEKRCWNIMNWKILRNILLKNALI